MGRFPFSSASYLVQTFHVLRFHAWTHFMVVHNSLFRIQIEILLLHKNVLTSTNCTQYIREFRNSAEFNMLIYYWVSTLGEGSSNTIRKRAMLIRIRRGPHTMADMLYTTFPNTFSLQETFAYRFGMHKNLIKRSNWQWFDHIARFIPSLIYDPDLWCIHVKRLPFRAPYSPYWCKVLTFTGWN